MDVAPVIINSRTLVPMRAIFEALGSQIVWDLEKRRIKASTPSGMELVLTIDSKKAILGGFILTLDVPPQIIDGRTMVPVRIIAEAMGAEISWESGSSLITIVSGAGGIGGPANGRTIKGVPLGPPPGPIERAKETARKLQELGHKVEFVSEYPVGLVIDKTVPKELQSRVLKNTLNAQEAVRRFLFTPEFPFTAFVLPSVDAEADAAYLFRKDNYLPSPEERKTYIASLQGASSAGAQGIWRLSAGLEDNAKGPCGIISGMAHEYVHLVQQEFGGSSTFLLDEGIAEYIAMLTIQQCPEVYNHIRHERWNAAKTAPPLSSWDLKFSSASYGISLLAIEFLVNSRRFTPKDLGHFLTTVRLSGHNWKEAFEGTFGIPFDAFWYIYSKKALPRILEDESYRPNFDEYVKAWYVRPPK
ncbi:MAG: copper amine oxidase N-terminal domain-containing protein [Candidatus Wildermuthbacteria bacterium]|nr:copper amine oxidase N-terminal domain-containing protein [Candidatus Wildermuthbacteria bacterium]